jgi:hypothetical protein
MTEADYERERAKLREAYGDNSIEAGARRDQALAALFYRSGWTIMELAAKEKQGHQYISRRLIFGRFLTVLENSPIGEFPKNLTEGRFRKYWEQSVGTERERFRLVQRLMAEDLVLHKRKGPSITDAAKEHFGDGKWHAAEKFAEKLEVTPRQVEDAIRRASGFFFEKKQVGKSYHFRIFRKDRMVSTDVLSTKLGPIIKDLKAEGKKNMATMAPAQVAYLAGLLEELLDTWTKGPQ